MIKRVLSILLYGLLTGAQGGMMPGPGTVHAAGGCVGIALVAHAQIAGSQLGGTSGAITWAGTPPTIIIVSVAGAGFPTTPTDSQGNTYTLGPNTSGTTGGGVGAYNAIFYAANPTVVSGMTVTASFGSAVDVTTQIEMFSGVASSSPYETIGNASEGAGSAVTSGSFTPSPSKSLVVVGISHAATSVTVDSSLSITDQGPLIGGTAYGGAMAWLVQNPAASINATWTLTGGSGGVSAGGAFKPAC